MGLILDLSWAKEGMRVCASLLNEKMGFPVAVSVKILKSELLSYNPNRNLMLEMEPRNSCMLGKCSAAELHTQLF